MDEAGIEAQKASPRGMETLQEALERLERRGFVGAFRALRGGLLELTGERAHVWGAVAPESLVVDEIVRFEGASDPADEIVLFALRSPDGRIRGTFVASYGPRMDPDGAAVVQRLQPFHASEGDARRG